MRLPNLYNSLKSFIRSEKAFFKNVSFVVGGKVYIAILSLLLTPIIARLFAPEAYGEFALYNTVIQNLVVLGTLSLPLAVSTVKKNALESVFNATIAIILFFSAIFIITSYLLNPLLDKIFSTTLFTQYQYILLIAIALSSINITLASLNVRLKRFRLNTKINVIESSSAKLFNLFFGWLNWGGLGLILSDLASKVINFLILLIKLPKEIKWRILKYAEVKEILRKHKDFPLYAMPSAWLGTISNQVIILIVAYLYDKNTLGLLSMSISLLNIPLNILSNSFQPVITERLVALRDGDKSHRFYEKMMALLLTLSTLCFATIYILPGSFFIAFLGDKWLGINSIINIYCWYYIILLIDQSFQFGFVIFDKQREKLLFNILDIILLIAACFFSMINSLPFTSLLSVFISIKIIISASRVIYLWNIARN